MKPPYKSMNNSRNKKILTVLAHPDDETFGMGGTLALYSACGADVSLTCATRGEAGEVDTEHMKGFSSVAEMREKELRCAARSLGLKNVFFLDYRDSGMTGSHENKHPNALIQQSIDEVAGKIVGYIRDLRPDIVLTFDPIGGYRHPDHVHIHKATTLAFEESGNANFYPYAGSPYHPLALYYHTISHDFLKVAIFLLRIFKKDPRKFGRNGDIDLLSIVETDYPVHVKINIHLVRKKKGMATLCHASQGGVHIQRGLMGWVRWLFGENEMFMRAYPPCAPCKRPANDLFKGISPE